MSKKPNILFICTDQQRWDTIGKYKPANLQTPNLDRLLKSSVHLPNTYCQAPICIPSRACLLTGQYAFQTGIYHNTGTLPADKTTWSRVLSNNGYETLCVGRAHGINQGFDQSIHIPFGDSFFEMSSSINGPDEKWTYSHYDYKHLPHIYEGDFEEYMDVRCINTACHALRDLKDAHKPWAMYLGILAPHNPYIVPRKYADFYKADDFPMPKVFDEDFCKPSYTERQDRYWKQFTEDDIRETRKMYYSMVTMVDELLGRVLKQLDKLGMTENTVIIFTSDHGEMNGDHGRWAKINFYEESVKIPCLISCPGIFNGGTESNAMVEGIDLMPTLLELAGVEIPATVSGTSLKGLLTGVTTKHKSVVYSTFDDRQFNGQGWKVHFVRMGQYCFSYGYATENGLTGELYDMQKDPDQRYNLYDDPNYRQVRNDMIEKTLEFAGSNSYQLHTDQPELSWKHPLSQHMY